MATFQGKGLNLPRHCTSYPSRKQAPAQGVINRRSEYSKPTAPDAESTNLCGPQWVLERDGSPFGICIGLRGDGGDHRVLYLRLLSSLRAFRTLPSIPICCFNFYLTMTMKKNIIGAILTHSLASNIPLVLSSCC